MHDKDLKMLFGEAEITPDIGAKQKAKERMLLHEERGIITMETKTNGESYEQPQDNNGKRTKITPIFKFTMHHFQGAVAMLLVCVLTLSTIVISGNGEFLLGTTFRGYADAVEQKITIFPGSIEAVKDYSGQAFTVTGLPVDELANIKPEHIFLGGYFSGLTVQAVEVSEKNIIVTAAITDAGINSGEVDWEDYNGDNGLIAVSPEAFGDKSSYYQGEVDVIYPELVSETEAIAQKDDLTISQEITLTLKNDSFVEPLSEKDLAISGGFENVQIQDFKQNENTFSFKLTGKADGNFSDATFSISGNKLTKGLDVVFTTGIGRVPTAVQSSRLYVNSQEPQTLRIFMDYDSFTNDVNLSMLTFNGLMNDFEVINTTLVNSKTIELTLAGGPEQPGTGSICFDSAAVVSGRVGRVAEITVENINHAASSNTSSPTAVAAKAKTANQTVASIPGFSLMCSLAWRYGSAEIRKNDTTGSFFSMLGLTPAEKETTKMLSEINGKLDDMSKQIDVNDKILNKRLDLIEYSISATVAQNNLNSIDLLYKDFQKRINDKTISQETFDNWCYENLRYTASGQNPAKNYLNTLGLLLEEINPYNEKNVLQTESLFKLFEQTCKSGTPFEHNTYMAVASYAWGWDAAIANYMSLATTIVDYNRDNNTELSPEGLNNLFVDFESLSNAVSVTFSNIESYVNAQPYAKAYEQLIASDKPNKVYYVVDSQNGEAYLIADSLNNQYNLTVHGKEFQPVNPGVRTSLGFLSHEKLSSGNAKKSYLAINPEEKYNNKNFKMAVAENKTTITAPDKVNSFLRNMAVTELSLNDVLNTYLISYDNGQSRQIQELWNVDVQWVYSARTDIFRNSIAIYHNDRTLMIDAGNASYNAYSITCEDGLYKNKQNVKKDDKIVILMCAE